MPTKRKWTDEQLIQAIKDSESWRGLCKKLGVVGHGKNFDTFKKHAKRLGLDTSHFLGKSISLGRERDSKTKRALSEILNVDTYYSSNRLKMRLVAAGIKKLECEECGLVQWRGERLPLELHHINGINTDNRLENLSILCPNCHSQK